jgi:hypothetical protein
MPTLNAPAVPWGQPIETSGSPGRNRFVAEGQGRDAELESRAKNGKVDTTVAPVINPSRHARPPTSLHREVGTFRVGLPRTVLLTAAPITALRSYQPRTQQPLTH